eukprot:CAMPEP_0183536788 /NCGR_PEP_ID=MMETSP0371-20130417/28482_1 /TAXON_ID=268820 /ORGANISM="Peridinium aciculiferum, Strain PAER-2" /LENGTH=129 /DNA_ID=CAMNT_0025737419 /DNA_START=1 /DNA_END=387 /DNA_ORIENTATION=+
MVFGGPWKEDKLLEWSLDIDLVLRLWLVDSLVPWTELEHNGHAEVISWSLIRYCTPIVVTCYDESSGQPRPYATSWFHLVVRTIAHDLGVGDKLDAASDLDQERITMLGTGLLSNFEAWPGGYHCGRLD